MKIRTVYFKVTDMAKAAGFWEGLLQLKPHKAFDGWHEFKCENIRLGLLLNDFGDKISAANCVPVFELSDDEMVRFIDRAKSLGATTVVDGLNDPHMKSYVMADPCGNEFELSKCHE